MYYTHFRIRYIDPLGNVAYYHDMALTKRPILKGETFFVQDTKTGFISPYKAECHQLGGVGRVDPKNTRRFRVYEENLNAL